MASHGEAMPPLGAAGTNNRSAASGLHTDTKTVRALATDN